VFQSFWFWTVTYGRQYASLVPLSAAEGAFSAALPPIAVSNPGIWILAGAGLVFLWWKREKLSNTLMLLALLLLFSFAAVCVGFYFRQHYFVLILPAIALLTGAGVEGLRKMMRPVWLF
jgi:hypothetical protein